MFRRKRKVRGADKSGKWRKTQRRGCSLTEVRESSVYV